MILCAGRNETFPFATPIGVGLIESAMNLTQLCLFNKPDYIIFIGSAGSYGEHKIFDILTSSSAANIELSFFDGDSYTPLDNVIETQNATFENQTIVNSSNYITSNIEKAKNFLPHNIGLENMEFFSLCSVAKEFEIPIAGIFVVTNYTDSNAHKEFLSNHQEAMDRLVVFVKEKGLIK